MNDKCRALPLGKQVMMEQRTQLSTPASVAPHPLLRHLTYPNLKLLLHLGRDPFHVFGVIATAGNLELFPIDLKAALFAEAQTTAHPYARTHAASNDSWHGHGGRWASKERDRQTRSVVQVADEAEPPALAYKVHDQPSGVLTFRTAAPPTEQPSGIESSSSLAQIEVNVGVFDGAIDCGRIIAGDRERPDRQLPIARVQGYADCRTKFVPIARKNLFVRNLDSFWLSDYPIDLHRLGHHAPEVLPHRKRDILTLPDTFLRESDC